MITPIKTLGINQIVERREDLLVSVDDIKKMAKSERNKAIDEFAEAIMVKATELSEKVVFDGRLVGDALSLDCVSDMVLEIAEQMKADEGRVIECSLKALIFANCIYQLY